MRWLLLAATCLGGNKNFSRWVAIIARLLMRIIRLIVRSRRRSLRHGRQERTMNRIRGTARKRRQRSTRMMRVMRIMMIASHHGRWTSRSQSPTMPRGAASARGNVWMGTVMRMLLLLLVANPAPRSTSTVSGVAPWIATTTRCPGTRRPARIQRRRIHHLQC